MIRRLIILILLLSVCLGLNAQSDSIALTLGQELPTVQGEQAPSENSVTADTTGTAAKGAGWLRQLADSHFNFKDTTISYPKFVGFLVDVYNWGDEFFNGTDPEYVQGTGRRWKVLLKNDNWLDSYLMDFDHMNMRMMSDLYMGAGVYVQYMAVSVGYMLDMSNIIGNKPMNHKKLEFGFNCQRFNVEAFYNENTGGTYLRSFGDYKGGRLIRKEFPGLKLKQYGIHGYYFFNNREYSNGAAYSYSRIQKRSAGSFILGFGYSNLDINLDFRTLPYPLKLFMKIPIQPYVFHYDTYNLLIGYGYNWVFKRNFLFNITALPTIGINYTREDSSEAFLRQIALGAKGRIALVYNYKDFFFSINGRFDGNLYRSNHYALFSSIEDFGAVIGLRF